MDFRVGDRVRVHQKTSGALQNSADYCEWFERAKGHPATIMSDDGSSRYRYWLKWDDPTVASPHPDPWACCSGEEIEPLPDELPEDV